MRYKIECKGQSAFVPYTPIGVIHGYVKLMLASCQKECQVEMIENHQDRTSITYGSLKIPDKIRLRLGKTPGFFFGKLPPFNSQQRLFVGKSMYDDGHIMGIGEAGRGKTQSLVIPTMATWTGSQVIFDIKGDLRNYRAAFHEHDGKAVKIFSPGSVYGCKYDPYAPLQDGGRDSLVENAQALAQALMPAPIAAPEPVWYETAQTFLASAHLYYYNLGATFPDAMFQIINNPVWQTMQKVMNSDDCYSKLLMNKLTEVEEKVISNIGMELGTLACFVSNSKIRDALTVDETSNVLNWREVSTSPNPIDVILEVPEQNLAQWEPMIRLMVNQMVRTLEMRPPRTYDNSELPPILVMLDEFPRLGKVPAIKSGLTTLRSRGVTFALFVQSVAQLEEVYGPATSGVIMENCTYKAVLGSTDSKSQKYFADLVGTEKSAQASTSISLPVGCGVSIGQTSGYIIHPHEFATIEDIVLFTRYGVCRVKKAPFFENRELFTSTLITKAPDIKSIN